MNTTIVRLYKELADVTTKHCIKTCARMGACCSKEYCDIAIGCALDIYGMELQVTGNLKLPLLNEDGTCSAPPHVRPMCTAHQCDIAGVAILKGEPEETKKYFSLRNEIDILEIERFT